MEIKQSEHHAGGFVQGKWYGGGGIERIGVVLAEARGGGDGGRLRDGCGRCFRECPLFDPEADGFHLVGG